MAINIPLKTGSFFDIPTILKTITTPPQIALIKVLQIDVNIRIKLTTKIIIPIIKLIDKKVFENFLLNLSS